MKSIFEEMGGTYRKDGDYYIPNLELPPMPDYQIGKYGRMRRSYLKEHRPSLYSIAVRSADMRRKSNARANERKPCGRKSRHRHCRRKSRHYLIHRLPRKANKNRKQHNGSNRTGLASCPGSDAPVYPACTATGSTGAG